MMCVMTDHKCGGECWRDIAGYGGKYQVSCRGRIISFARKAPKILKQSKLNKKEYLRVGLSRGSDGVEYLLVHRLVADAYLRRSAPTDVVRHLNDMPADNRVENLAFGSQKQNAIDSLRNGRIDTMSVEVVRGIRAMSADGGSVSDVAKEFGVSRQTVRRIVSRRSWSMLV